MGGLARKLCTKLHTSQARRLRCGNGGQHPDRRPEGNYFSNACRARPHGRNLEERGSLHWRLRQVQYVGLDAMDTVEGRLPLSRSADLQPSLSDPVSAQASQ